MTWSKVQPASLDLICIQIYAQLFRKLISMRVHALIPKWIWKWGEIIELLTIYSSKGLESLDSEAKIKKIHVGRPILVGWIKTSTWRQNDDSDASASFILYTCVLLHSLNLIWNHRLIRNPTIYILQKKKRACLQNVRIVVTQGKSIHMLNHVSSKGSHIESE